MEENETPVVEATEIECQIAYLVFEMKKINDYFFTVTWSEDWKTWTLDEQKQFQSSVEVLWGMACAWKEKYDATVWAGHANGTVSTEIESIRTERSGEKPGKKAEVPTADSILAKRLKKIK